MPRYRYVCEACMYEKIVLHPYAKTPLIVCEAKECKGQMHKALTTPHIDSTSENSQTFVGDITEQFIKESREALETQRDAARKATYDPS